MQTNHTSKLQSLVGGYRIIKLLFLIVNLPGSMVNGQSLDWVRHISNSKIEEIVATCRGNNNDFIVSGLFTGITNFSAPGQAPQYSSKSKIFLKITGIIN